MRTQSQESTEHQVRGDVTLHWEVRKGFPEWVTSEQRPGEREVNHAVIQGKWPTWKKQVQRP